MPLREQTTFVPSLGNKFLEECRPPRIRPLFVLACGAFYVGQQASILWQGLEFLRDSVKTDLGAVWKKQGNFKSVSPPLPREDGGHEPHSKTPAWGEVGGSVRAGNPEGGQSFTQRFLFGFFLSC